VTGLLDGKKLLVTGVLNDDSIAFGVARLAQDQGAEVVLTSFGRAMSLTRRTGLAVAALPLMREAGGSIVGLDFDAGQAWPAYDWMGVAKAALEATSRYLARDLGRFGIRVNLVSAGPLRSVAARGIPGFDAMEAAWTGRSPLGWDTRDTSPVAKACVALLSDWFPATTGEIVHVDGGFHAIAAAAPPAPVGEPPP